MKEKFRYKNKLFLAVLFLTTCFSTPLFGQTSNEQERIYVKIEIKGMACPYCAFGMEKEFKKVAGVQNVDIELKKGLAYISAPLNQKPTKQSLEKIVTDAGFTVGKIEYSTSPFISKKDEKN